MLDLIPYVIPALRSFAQAPSLPYRPVASCLSVTAAYENIVQIPYVVTVPYMHRHSTTLSRDRKWKLSMFSFKEDADMKKAMHLLIGALVDKKVFTIDEANTLIHDAGV